MRRLSPLVTTFGLMVVLMFVLIECGGVPGLQPTPVAPPTDTPVPALQPQVIVYLPGGKQVLPAHPDSIQSALNDLIVFISLQAKTFYSPEKYAEVIGPLPRVEAVYPRETSLATLAGSIPADRIAVAQTEHGVEILTQVGNSAWSVWAARDPDGGLFSNLAEAVAAETGVRIDRTSAARVPTAKPTQPPALVTTPFVKITEPVAGQSLTGQVVARGRAGGLFENTFILELRDSGGNILAMRPVTITAADMGMAGTFEVTLVWTPPAEQTTGTLWGIYRSPKDGSILAEDHLDVALLPATVSGPFIEIAEPRAGQTLAGRAVVLGRAGGLFENTFALELRDSSGKVLIMTPVTVAAPEMGMAGVFEVTLTWAPPSTQMAGSLWGIYRSPKDDSVLVETRVDVILSPSQ